VRGSSYRGQSKSLYLGLLTGYTGITNVDDEGSVILLLPDGTSSEDIPAKYPAGTQREALIEVTPHGKSSAPAAEIIVTPPGLKGFEFTEAQGRKVRIVHNITNAPVEYQGSMAAPYRAARIVPSWTGEDLSSPPVSGGKLTILPVRIPPYGHILVINSDLRADAEPGHREYQQVFDTP